LQVSSIYTDDKKERERYETTFFIHNCTMYIIDRFRLCRATTAIRGWSCDTYYE